jgi:hypothetical protein
MSDQAKACTLCEGSFSSYRMTGFKRIDDEDVPYQICLKCCRILQAYPPYKPESIEQRRKFWEKIWEKLKNDVVEKSLET